MDRRHAGHILVFLLGTFALSWGFQWLVSRTIGQEAYLALGLSPLGMLFPAFVALILRLFAFRESPLHAGRYRGRPRWILHGFLLLTLVYTGFTIVALGVNGQPDLIGGLGALLITLWTLLVFFVAGRSSAAEMQGAGLQLGDLGWGLKLALGVVAFFVFQAALNLVFGLGQWPGYAERIYGIAVPQGIYALALLAAFALAVTGIPLSGLAATFGEEYGWRGFLQDELGGLGLRQAAALVGLVWGIWHIPVILSDIHTYPPTLLGVGLGLLFFVLWGVFQSYALLKSGSIWVPAFLHGLVNSVYGFTLTYVAQPDDNVLSFGLGVYGLVCLAAVVLLILRDPVWRISVGAASSAGPASSPSNRARPAA